MTERAGLSFSLGPEREARRRREDRPLRFLVMGGLSGRDEDTTAFSSRRVAVGELDAALAKLEPTVTDGAGGASLRLTALEHFHPDHLIGALPDTRDLLALYRRLADPESEAAALAEYRALAGDGSRLSGDARSSSDTPPSGDAPSADAPSADAPRAGDGREPGEVAAPESEDDLLGRLLGARPDPERARRGRARDTVQRLIQDALQTSGPQGGAPPGAGDAASAREALAARLTERCRALLAQPDFRALERAWRSVHWLVSRLEDDEAEVHLLDVSKAALGEHLRAFGDRLETSPLHALLAEREDTPWDLVVGDYSFGLDAGDAVTLATIGALAGRAGATFVAHGDLTLAGCPDETAVEAPWEWRLPDDDLGKLWTELRRHPAAEQVALATPRFLLRHPYGAKSDPIERFAFEELPSRPDRERFLWGNPAFACALVFARRHAGEDAPVGGDTGLVEDLPAPLYDDGGGQAIQPPVEHLLTERARAAAEAAGLVVCAGGRNSNAMSIGALRSLAD